jgi:hypothetical protein
MQEKYATVFDISQHPYRELVWLILAIVVVFPLVAMLFDAIWHRKRPDKGLMLVVILFLFFAVPGLYFTWHRYVTLRSDYLNGKDSYTEGIVQNFVSLPKQESFSVNGHQFSYSDYVITQAFNNMATHGGPIREGLKVKIWFVGNDILRLDVAQNWGQGKGDRHN